MKFEIGNKVKLISIKDEDRDINNKIGDIGKIIDLTNANSPYDWTEIKWNNGIKSKIFYKNLKLVEENNMKKDDLKDYDIVTLRNGDKIVFINDTFCDLCDDNDNFITSEDDINCDLTYNCSYIEKGKNDIVKVERFNSLDTNIVYSREEKELEVTMSEVNKKFGCKVKIKE